MDERQELNAGRASMIVLGVIALVALGVLVYEYLTTKEVTNGWAILTLVGSGALLGLLMFLMGGPEAPRSWLGKELPTGDTPEEKSARRNWYAIDSGLFAVAMTVLSVGGLTLGDSQAIAPAFLKGTGGLILGGALSFIASFVIYFGITYAIGEWKSRKVEARIAETE